MKGSILKLAVVGMVAFAACKKQGPEAQTTKTAPPSLKKNAGAVKVEFFVMSQCPYGVEVVNKIKEPLDQLGADVDFTMDFIGQIEQGGALKSMHGPNEVTGDIVQLCAARYAPDKYLNMVLCQNKNFREVATNWESCAKEAQLPVDSIRECMNSNEGKELLTASFKRAEARQARGSPTIYVGGKPYSRGRSSNAFLKAICAEYTGAKPAPCENIPPPPAVNVTILSDKRCAKCNADGWVGQLRSRIENPQIKQLDYNDPEGKTFYESLSTPGAKLPMILFDSTLDADKDSAAVFSRALQPLGSAGTYRSLFIQASWDPACANEGGCKLPQCEQTLACRKEMPKTLEVFVMSKCPFGVKALNAMEEVLKAFENKLDFRVHFIGSSSPQGALSSMHGEEEVNEDVREICAMKHYPKNYQWMSYVLCRNKEISSTEWKKCAVEGIDAAVIEKCSTGEEGKKLLEQDFKIATGFGIGASPTWIANGKAQFNGIDAETVRKNFCEANKNDVKGCEKTLSGAGASGPAPKGCGQ
jgi:hypothetical protein